MFFITVRSSFPMTRTMVVGTWSGWHIVFLGCIILIGIWSQFVNLVNQFKKRVISLEQGLITGDGVGYNAR